MPAAGWSNFIWNGPAAAASVVNDAAGALTAGILGYASPDATLSGVGAVTDADITRLVNRPATLSGVGAISTALPKGRARPTATIRVNTLSQDDVTGAVLEAPLDGGLSLKQALRLLTSALVGKVSVSGNTVTFRDVADTKDRIVSTTDSNGQRTTVTTDPT